MQIQIWKHVIYSGNVFIIIGAILLGLVVGSALLSPNIKGTAANQFSNAPSSTSFPPLFSSVSSSSLTSLVSPETSSSMLPSSSSSETTSESPGPTTASTTYYTTFRTTLSQSSSSTRMANNASLVLDPTSGPPSSQFSFAFTGGKSATQYYEESFYGQNMTFITNSAGSFVGSITVPFYAQPHGYAIRIEDSDRNLVAVAMFIVTNTTTTTSTPTTLTTTTTATTFSTSSAFSSTTFSSSNSSTKITTSTTITAISNTTMIDLHREFLGSLAMTLLLLTSLPAIFQRKNCNLLKLWSSIGSRYLSSSKKRETRNTSFLGIPLRLIVMPILLFMRRDKVTK